MFVKSAKCILGAALLAGGAPVLAEHHEEEAAVGGTAALSADKTLQAARLVTEGKVYALGIITGRNTPAYPGRDYEIEVIDLGSNGSNQVTGHDDRVDTYLGIGSQIDGLGHVGTAGVHFGGVKAEDIFSPDGLRDLGTEDIPPIATRGVLIDMTRYFGVERMAELQGFGSAEIRAAAEQQGVTIGAGDVVLFHTGWMQVMDEDPEGFILRQPGINAEGARYLAQLGVVAVGSDTAGLETSDYPEGMFIPVHQILLAEYGIHILETLDTSELAADEAWEFLFVLGAPRLEGSVQAIINPVAIR